MNSAFLSLKKLNSAYFLFLALAFSSHAIDLFGQKKSISFDEVKDEENYGRFRYIELKGHSGYHLYTGEILDDVLNDGYGALELRYGWQSKDPDHWSSRYNYVTYGLGLYSGLVGTSEIVGKPKAVFGFLTFPLSNRGSRNILEAGLSLGMTFNLEPFDPKFNPDNDAIGSPLAVYFNLNFGGAYKLTRELDLLYGIDFTHFSGGRITTPNYGYNMYGLNLGMRYYYNADQKFVDKDVHTKDLLPARFEAPAPSKQIRLRESSVEVYLAGGTVQNEEDKGTYKRYGVFSSALDYRFKFNSMHAVSAGFDFFWDGSLEPEYPKTEDQTLVGAHLGYDFLIGRMALRLQLGTYLTDDKGKSPSYIRAGFRYDITKWMFGQLSIKTQKTSRADWVEFGVGFTPFKW